MASTFALWALFCGAAPAFAHSGEVFAAWSTLAPAIDGVLSPGEWADAAVVTSTISNCSGRSPLTIWAKTDGSRLHVALKVEQEEYFDPTTADDEAFRLLFDDAHDGAVGPGLENLWWAGIVFNGDALVAPGSGIFFDADVGGTNDVTTALSHTNPVAGGIGDYVVEYSGALNSTDDAFDFDLLSTQTVGMALLFFSECGDQIWPDPSGVPLEFADVVVTPPPFTCGDGCCDPREAACSDCPAADCTDTDGDGLADAWETTGLDFGCDGIVEVDLAALGAQPLRRDVFLELDYMERPGHSHAFAESTLDLVRTAFACAPVSNPDGSTGITLHVELDDAIPEVTHIAFEDVAPCTAFPDSVNFYDLKAMWFDDLLRPAFHYGILAHRRIKPTAGCATTTSTGQAEIAGNDIIVSMGDGGLTGGVAIRQAGTLMHELGHNLGLRHGGFENCSEYKPNYSSVMAYGKQQRGLTTAAVDACHPPLRVDYSRGVLATLDESALDEVAGVGPTLDDIVYYCPDGDSALGLAGEPIDWDCDGVIEANVSADVDSAGACSAPRTVHAGFDDWTNLFYAFQCRPNTFNDGLRPDNVLPEELDDETAERLGLDVPLLPVVVDVRPGNDHDQITRGAAGVVPVAILGSETVDAARIVEASLRFCDAPAERVQARDVDRDGRLDLVAWFRMDELDIGFRATQGMLRGELAGGDRIFGIGKFKQAPALGVGPSGNGALRRRRP